MTSAINIARNVGRTFSSSNIEMMHKKSCLFVGLIVLSILTICLYSAFYSKWEIPTIFGTYIITEIGDSTVKQKYLPVWEYKKNDTKTILLWNSFFGDKNFYFGEGDIFRDCPVNTCKIFNERNYLNVEDFDAILFHGNEMDEYEIPERRRMRQLYVYVNLESPANRPIPYRYCEDYFNLTMTYRLDSDVPWTYAIIQDIKTGKIVAPSKNVDWDILKNATSVEEVNKILDVVRGKSKLVTWFVSNCEAKSGRQEYVMELSKYISVDIYGKCGTHSCSRSSDCFRDIAEPNYFFYLSFENSFCEDYVTEKLMNPLSYNIVPVVYGGANYSQFAPPNSYVNALDFESPKELAIYLKYLSQDLWQYQNFFEWKKHYRVELATHRAVCTLCKVLHKQKKPKRYAPLSDWYAKNKCPIQMLLANTGNKYATNQIRKLKQYSDILREYSDKIFE